MPSPSFQLLGTVIIFLIYLFTAALCPLVPIRNCRCMCCLWHHQLAHELKLREWSCLESERCPQQVGHFIQCCRWFKGGRLKKIWSSYDFFLLLQHGKQLNEGFFFFLPHILWHQPARTWPPATLPACVAEALRLLAERFHIRFRPISRGGSRILRMGKKNDMALSFCASGVHCWLMAGNGRSLDSALFSSVCDFWGIAGRGFVCVCVCTHAKEYYLHGCLRNVCIMPKHIWADKIFQHQRFCQCKC